MDDKEEKKVKKSKKLKKEVKICKESDDESESETEESTESAKKVKRPQEEKGDQNEKPIVKKFIGGNFGNNAKVKNLNQIASQVNMNVAPKKEFLGGDEKFLIRKIKNCYKEKDEIEIIFSERRIPIEKGGYINLAIVKEEEQRKKENEAMNEEDKDSKKDKSEDKVFTDKRITSFEDIYGTKTSIALKDIFGIGRRFKSVLLLGRAGIGKSTVCQYIAYQWANEKLWDEQFDLILWIPLRNLLDKNKYSGNKINSHKVIYEECFTHAFKEENKFNFKTFAECFKKIPEDKILYVLDGYDEIAHLGDNTPARKVISEVFLKKKNIILTSRPHYLKQNPFLHKENNEFQRVETIGFLDKDIESYIELFFKETDLEEKSDKNKNSKIYSDSLKQFFKEAPNAKGIAHIPINLALICQAWKEHHGELKEIKNKHFTLSMLYHGLLQSLCIRYLKRHQAKEEIRMETWAVISTKGRCPKILDALKELAFKQMVDENKNLIIESDKVMSLIKEKDDEYLLDDLINFGLLKSVNSYHVKKEKQSYYFIHLTFQEFLAAFYIADKLREEESKSNKEKDTDESIDIKAFIKKNKYHPRYEIVWWFVAGLLKEKKDKESRELFFECIEDEKSKDIVGVAHQCLLIRCFDECGEIDDEGFKKRKESFIAQLWVQINASIRRDLSGMSKIIFNYLGISPCIYNHESIQLQLVELLEDKDSIVRSAAAEALVGQSSLPQGILDKLYKLLEDEDWNVRIAAVQALGKQSSFPQGILDKLVGLLEDEDRGVRSAAAEALGGQFSLLQGILDKLVKLLKDEDRDARYAAAKALGGQSSLPQGILDKLDKLLEDEDGDVRSTAAEALVGQSSLPQGILDKLVELLEDEGWNVRSAAAKALVGQSSLPKGILDKLVELLEDEDWNVRIAAVQALGKQSSLPQGILDKLVELLEDEDGRVRFSAAEALGGQSSLPQGILDKLVGLFEHKDWELKSAGRRALYSQSLLNLFNYFKKNKNADLMEIIVRKSLFEKIPICKNVNNKRNIFLGNTEVEFETSAQRNQVIKDFQKGLVKVTGVKVIQTKESKVSEFFGGFFNLRHTSTAKLNEKEVVDDKDENTEDRDACLMM